MRILSSTRNRVGLAFLASILSQAVPFPAPGTPGPPEWSYSPPDQSETDYNLGLAAYKQKQYDQAVKYLWKSITEGNKKPEPWLLMGNAYLSEGKTFDAAKTYQTASTVFKDTPAGQAAAEYLRRLGPRALTTPNPPAKVVVAAASRPAAAPAAAPAGASKPAPAAAIPLTAASPGGLMNRIVVIAPLFNHPAVSRTSIEAAQQAIAALPRPLRAKLDASAAQVIISPNMIDRWPESIKDLPESDEAPTLAELPGRIYGLDMCVYEHAKVRGSTALKESRPPAYIRLQVANMCFQLLDDMMTISKDPALLTEWEGDKANVPASLAETKLATFMKTDDWGPRETCSELFGAMLGGRDENTDNLYRYFPRTKRWLAAKLGVAG